MLFTVCHLLLCVFDFYFQDALQQARRKSIENTREIRKTPLCPTPGSSDCSGVFRTLWIDHVTQKIRGYSGGKAASVSLRIFFWPRQKLRCVASRPSVDGKMLVIEPRARCGIRTSKRKAIRLDGFSFWSRVRESNPPPRLGKPLYYRCTNPAYVLEAAMPRFTRRYGSTPAAEPPPCPCAFSFGCAKSCDAAHRDRLSTAKCL